MTNKTSERENTGRECTNRDSDKVRKGSDLMSDAPTPIRADSFYKGLAIGKEIGSGRFSRVYSVSLAGVPSISYALKVYYERADLCMKEAEALEQLASNPHVVQLKDVGTHEGRPCLLMERASYSVRKALGDQHTSGDVRTNWALGIYGQMLDAVSAAHAKGIVHGDIKSDNALVLDGVVKVTDFNLSKTDGVQNLEGRLTVSQGAGSVPSMAGTLCYSAPEGIRSPRADVYSLGVVLYELLTGKLPVGRYAPASKLAGAPNWIDTVIDKALSADPSERYKDAGALQEAVKSLSAQKAPSRFDRAIDALSTIDIGDLCKKTVGGIGTAVWTAAKYTVLLPYTICWSAFENESDRVQATTVMGSLLYGLCMIPVGVGINTYSDKVFLRELQNSPPRGRIVWYDNSAQRIKSIAGKDIGKDDKPVSVVGTDLSRVSDLQKGPNGTVYILRKYGDGGEVQSVNPANGDVSSVVKAHALWGAKRIAVNGSTINVLVEVKDESGRWQDKWFEVAGGELKELTVFTDPGTPVPESPDGKYRFENAGDYGVQVIKPNDSWADRELLGVSRQVVWTDGE